MNLETRLPNALWEAVRINYEKRNFTGSILDAFYFLSELLRNKSGTEGDGGTLVGQAFGGASPKIKLNRLQTDSEKNVQRGMEQLLRGLYQSIRNPRSHDKIADSDEDAQTLIMFVGYLVKQIDQAKAQFTRPDFVRRVLDPDFVPQQRYAELLVAEIPERERLEIFLDLYREKEYWLPRHMSVFLPTLLGILSEDEVKQVCEVLSEDLKVSESETGVRAVLGSLPPSLWSRIGEAARLRVENKLIRSVRDGRCISDTRKCRSGELGTWAINIFSVMTMKDEMISAIAHKLWADSTEEHEYVFQYLMGSISKLSETVPPQINSVLVTRLKNGDQNTHTLLCILPPWNQNLWPDSLKKAYDSFAAVESTKGIDDDIPF